MLFPFLHRSLQRDHFNLHFFLRDARGLRVMSRFGNSAVTLYPLDSYGLTRNPEVGKSRQNAANRDIPASPGQVRLRDGGWHRGDVDPDSRRAGNPAHAHRSMVPRPVGSGPGATAGFTLQLPCLGRGSKMSIPSHCCKNGVLFKDRLTMIRWFYVALHLLVEATAARRDARVRFMKAQIEILRRKLGGNRVIPSPEDRARLLSIGRELDHDVGDVIGIVTPQTYCRWVAELRQGRKPKRVGRPRIARNLREIALRLARENAGWGYRRIIGELRKLRLPVSRSSVRRILKEEGLTPSPTRRGKAGETTWRKFIRLHVDTLVACDFFTKNVITPFGIRIAYCLAFIHVGTRRVFLSPPTYHPNEQWVKQQARNVMMATSTPIRGERGILHMQIGAWPRDRSAVAPAPQPASLGTRITSNPSTRTDRGALDILNLLK